MICALITLGLLSLLLSATAHPISRRTAPATAALVYTAAALVIALASTSLLAVLGWFTLARFPPVAHAGGWSGSQLSRRQPVPGAVSAIAGLTIFILVVRVVLMWRRRAYELLAAHRELLPPGPDGITVLANDAVDAFAVEGTPTNRRVVLTNGLLRHLADPTLRQAVIDHERSHLRHHHLAYRLTAETAARANPLLRPITCIVDNAVEAWADNDAARTTGPATVASALALIAIAQAAPTGSRVALGVANSTTVRRIERLLHPPRVTRLGAIPGGVLAVIALIVVGIAFRHTESFFETLRAAGVN